MMPDLLPIPIPAGGLPTAAVPRDRHPVATYLLSLNTETSRRAQGSALQTIAGMLVPGADLWTVPWWALRYPHLRALQAALLDRYQPATARRMMAAVRRVLKECWRLDYIDAETYQRATELEPIRGTGSERGRRLAAGELRALFDAAGTGPGGARDAALLAVLYGGGLRRFEAVALDLADYAAETGSLTVRQGKGRKARLVYATHGARLALEDWIAVRSTEPGSLFCPVDKAGRVTIRHLTAQAVYLTLQRLAGRAGVAVFSPHDLRRTFVSDLLDAGADVSSVQRLAGHASVDTTTRYDRRDERAKQRAADLLHVPYARAVEHTLNGLRR